MIIYKSGDIFESNAKCLVNTVNCEGFMGKGIAYQFKLRFPDNNKAYIEACDRKTLRPGTVLTYLEKGLLIVNFPTKDKWREPSRMEYIDEGLQALKSEIIKNNIKDIAIPPLGCGNGGLKWNDVKVRIEEALKDLDCNVYVYEPGGKISTISEKDMNAEDLLLLYIRGQLQNVTSLRFQKTLYFTNYFAGSSIYSFSRGKYGPYSKMLYSAAERMGDYQKQHGYKNSYETYKAIYRVICSKRTDSRLDRLKEASDRALSVVNDVQDDHLLEGMATALFLIKDEQKIKKDDVVQEFANWSEDKHNRFKNEDIEKSLEQLEAMGFIQKNLFDEYEIEKP
ncbi:MAG: macro domain-containing protein [Butyrivibrio sp.]|uniref:type II toxin-antitoxin system antitoxin DNA ADP-ribosyl glycohydrolase DarG n=1 Tax=Butyrivibrio sp. TaxID=28121 RepID=UPI001B1A5CAB|nr:macro domain-containing protein [Butyrivibrio sp.]MBO6239493.1 macro domain-containing protein [Butyrivibrio sp.]MBP3239098.1 macro domain-containing protein [Oribacterium sp.]